MTEFRQTVYRIVRAIPRGEVRTYGEVAKAAGRPGAARAVGAIMRTNPITFLDAPHDPAAVPCHRVVAASYRLHGFNRGVEHKQQLLEHEGWIVRNQRLEHV